MNKSLLKEEYLKCDICGEIFNCEHQMVDTAFGKKLNVPHCLKCGYDYGLCPDKHGYQCSKCQNFYPELNIKP